MSRRYAKQRKALREAAEALAVAQGLLDAGDPMGAALHAEEAEQLAKGVANSLYAAIDKLGKKGDGW